MSKQHKEYGVVYTPQWIVDLILDNTIQEYTADMRVCDPACGDGAFLVRLVERICDTLADNDCRIALQNITGLEIDATALAQCKKRLDTTLQKKGKHLNIKWNLQCLDSTNCQSLAPYEGSFDYVIGNPPYVRIQNLGKSRRIQLQKTWRLAQHGSTDLYIAFFEIGMFLLKPHGWLGYITPNTYAKTAAGQSLRRFIVEQHGIACMVDFGAYQVFKNATTYSLITVLNKNNKLKKFALYRYTGKNIINKGMVLVSHLSASEIWILESEQTLREIEKLRSRGRPLGELADIHVGLQTLADKIFILEVLGEQSGTLIANDFHGNQVRIESAIARPILKASVLQNGRDIKSRIIIFPYQDGKLIAEQRMQEEFPLAYQYLAKHKKILLARDNGNLATNRWYAFGREFGLTTTFGDKILTSGMNKKPNFQKCPAPQYTFYAGYCIKPKAGLDIDQLLTFLNSAEMDFYIRHTSRDYQNGWKSYAKSFLQDYGIPIEVTGRSGQQTSLW